MRIEENFAIKDKNTFGMDVKARVWAEYASVEELRELLARYRGEKILPIGQGSNMLFTADFDGVLLRSAMCRARALDEDSESVLIEAEAGLVLDELIEQLVDMGLGGLENLSYIPGTVGASAVQNVGAYGVEAKDTIVAVKTLDMATGEEKVFQNEECAYGYRDSYFKHEGRGRYIVTSVIYRLEKRPELHLDYGNLREALQEKSLHGVREAIIRIRKQKLPEVSEWGSAGSFFTNPVVSQEKADSLLAQYPNMPHYAVADGVKVPAAWLIEQCGWKGKALAGARVWEKQPLVLINAGNARPEDVVQLAAAICASVKEKFGVTISPEVNYIS